MGRRGRGEVPKKYSFKGKLNEKNSCTPSSIPKNIHGLALKKKNHTREMLTKKNSCGQELITSDAAQKFATLPITFSLS